ncbi:hypothetical protein L7F22_058335 [Adiantum nelumboides]|nr:hypothetical protein [Adiantum nelumboides]
MDDIFEQMLSTSQWGNGMSANRLAAWDAMVPSSTNNMAMDSSVQLQAQQKASLNNVAQLGEGFESEGVIISRAMQEENMPLTAEPMIFDTGQGHVLPVTHIQGLQPLPPTLYIGGFPPTLHGLSSGNPDVQGSAEAIPQDSRHQKRPREGDILSLNRQLSRNLATEGVKSVQSFGDQAMADLGQDLSGGAASGAGKARVRARRGQATDPHSIAERNRRERIAERMKALQELVPDSNKTDKASMLDEIIGYVKFLQMLGGTGAAAPLLADLPVEGAASFLAANLGQASMCAEGSSTPHEGMAFAERQIARLMDEDMSAAMQYLQSKGLCLMPISLATAISSTGAPRQPPVKVGAGGPAGNIKQAMELQAAAMAAAAAVGGSASAAPFSCNPKSAQDGTGSGEKMHANVARSFMLDFQRDDKSKADKTPLPPPPMNKSKQGLGSEVHKGTKP